MMFTGQSRKKSAKIRLALADCAMMYGRTPTQLPHSEPTPTLDLLWVVQPLGILLKVSFFLPLLDNLSFS